MTATDPVRALRGALERMRQSLRAVAGDAAQYPGIEEDLKIAERAADNLCPPSRLPRVSVTSDRGLVCGQRPVAEGERLLVMLDTGRRHVAVFSGGRADWPRAIGVHDAISEALSRASGAARGR